MKGVILAGGKGTRLRPTTRVINKHVIPIYDRPMIYYPVETLIEAGINDILVISNAEHIGKYIELLESDFDADFHYKVQSEPRGIAHGVGLAQGFVEEDFVVVLGDNVLLGESVADALALDGGDAKIFVKHVDEPAAYGVASVDDGEVVQVKEKPSNPESNFAVIGLYRYTDDVFSVIDDLDPSDRGEYEITDVNEHYVKRGSLEYHEYEGKWFDAGTPEGVFRASRQVRDRELQK